MKSFNTSKNLGNKTYRSLSGIGMFLVLIITILPCSVVSQNTPNEPGPYGYAQLSPSVALIIIVLISAIFLALFLTIYIRHCSNANTGPGSVMFVTNMARSRRAAMARGLDQAVIESFPTFVYSEVKNLKIGKGALECAVCLNEFEDDERLRLMPKCDHVFHSECIDAWLGSHTTCPVCRANLTPQQGDPVEMAPRVGELNQPEVDVEAQNINSVAEQERVVNNDTCNNAMPDEVENASESELTSMATILNRNRTRGPRSGRNRLRFPRSHSTGHSLVQPGENTERFTLRLPEEVLKHIMTRKLNRTVSVLLLPGKRSSRRGYRTGEGSSSSKYIQAEESDRRVFGRAPSFLARASSFLTRASHSVRSPRVASDNGEGTSSAPVQLNVVEPSRPPV